MDNVHKWTARGALVALVFGLATWAIAGHGPVISSPGFDGTLSGSLTGPNSETFDNGTDGSWIFTGVGGTNNEALEVDLEDTADMVTLSSSTGAALKLSMDLAGANDETFANGTDGAWILAGSGGSHDEDLKIDLDGAANEVQLSSSTSAQLHMEMAVSMEDNALYLNYGGDADTYFTHNAGDDMSIVVGGVDAIKMQETASDDRILFGAFRLKSQSQVLELGANATSGHSLGEDDVMVGADFEVDGKAYFDAIAITDADEDTIADSGDGNPATATLTPTTNYVELTCSDAHTCDITMGETGIVEGHFVRIVNLSANACDFADTAGVSELSAAFAMGQYDVLELIYTGDRWVEVDRSDN